MSRSTLLKISGLIWLAVGLLLLLKGVYYLSQCTMGLGDSDGSMKAKILFLAIWVAIALCAGFFKARYVLMRSVKRATKRLLALKGPVSLRHLYDWKGWVLLLGMMLIGMAFRLTSIPAQWRGVVDIAIGSALFHGALITFHFAKAIKQHAENHL